MRKGVIWAGGACLALSLAVLGIGASERDETVRIMGRLGQVRTMYTKTRPDGIVIAIYGVTAPAGSGRKADAICTEFADAGWSSWIKVIAAAPGPPAVPPTDVESSSSGDRELTVSEYADGKVEVLYQRPATWLGRMQWLVHL